MDISKVILDLVLGALLGALGGLFGIGGGLIAIPVLVLAYGMDQQHAQGTALVMIVPNVLIGLWRYAQRDRLEPKVALTLAGSAMVFTYVFALWATRLHATVLRYAFAAFIVVMAGYFTWRTIARPSMSSARPPLSWGWTALVGAIGGALSGLFGVGGATIAPPALTLFFGRPQTVAQGLALALVAPGAVIALIAYARASDVQWSTGIPLALGGLFSVSAGVALAHRLPEQQLRIAFSGLLIVTAVLLVVHA